jgi:hypothetical protein
MKVVSLKEIADDLTRIGRDFSRSLLAFSLYMKDLDSCGATVAGAMLCWRFLKENKGKRTKVGMQKEALVVLVVGYDMAVAMRTAMAERSCGRAATSYRPYRWPSTRARATRPNSSKGYYLL